MIAEEARGVVNRSRDIPACFLEHGYIEAVQEALWVRMTGFRNILVHEYLDADRGIVHETLAHDLPDLRALTRVFAQFL